MKSGDYYAILGVPKSATDEEIRRAYRKGARTYHPDVNSSPEADIRFKEINEANEVLKDPEKRKLYDLYGENWRHGGHSNQDVNTSSQERSTSVNEDGFRDFFSSIFENRSTENSSYDKHFYGDYYHQPPVYEAEITLSLKELLINESKTITFMTRSVNSRGISETKQKTLNVKIPRGVTDGSTIRLPDIDKDQTNSAGRSDLLLKVRVTGDKTFKIKGYDLETNIQVAPWEAALGAKVAVKTVDGYVTLTIPPLTRSGKRFRLKGKGLPQKQSGSGDIIGRIVIQIPEHLSNEEKRLFQELSRASNFDPRKEDHFSTV